MDSYKKLDWSKQHRRSEPRLLEYFAIDFSHYEEDIFNLHINEIDPVHQIGDMFDDDQVALKYPIDPRNGTEVRQLVIDTTESVRRLYDRFPTGSWLSRSDHQHCLTVLNRLNMRLGFETPEDQEALIRYKSLIGKIDKERALFDSFVKNYFNNNLVSRKRTIDPELDDLVVAIWRCKVQNMLDRISESKYHLSTAVMWLKYRKNDHNVKFEPASEDVLEFGVVKNIFTENLLRCNTLKRSKRIMDKFYEDHSESVAVDDSVELLTILKQDEDIRVVVNSGTLSHLLDNASNMQTRWMVPFRIETIGSRNVIIIEKKLQATKMLTHERNVKAHKYLVRSFMTVPKKDGNQPMDKKMDEHNHNPQIKFEYKAVAFDEYLRTLANNTQPVGKQQHNAGLQMWKLQEGDEQYRFLVRSRMDCYESLRKTKFYINMSIKLEYQAEFGSEQMTRSELIREWSRQFLRPNSKTLRLRINAINHVILSHHYLELKDIEEELKRSYDIEPRNLVTNLWQTLKLLLNFPPGEHLLHHDTKNPETVHVLLNDPKATFSSSSIDLKDLYANVEFERCALEQYEWTPIDKTVITKLHREHTLLPCTFPHWNNIQRIVPREKLKQKRKPPIQQLDSKTKKKKSKGNKARKKVREREKKQQMKKHNAFVNDIQQSLDKFAPYEGPSRSGFGSDGTASGNPTNAASSVNFAKGDSFDYQAYVSQANAKKEDQ